VFSSTPRRPILLTYPNPSHPIPSAPEIPNLEEMSAVTLKELERLDEKTLELLHLAFQVAQGIYIVTAGAGWWIKYLFRSSLLAPFALSLTSGLMFALPLLAQ